MVVLAYYNHCEYKSWLLLKIQLMMPSNHSWARSDSFMPDGRGFEDTEVSKSLSGKRGINKKEAHVHAAF